MNKNNDLNLFSLLMKISDRKNSIVFIYLFTIYLKF